LTPRRPPAPISC